MQELTPQQLNDRIKSGESFRFIDVREPDEWENGTLDQAMRIPMKDVPERINELDSSATTVVVCRSGGRSRQICEYLESQGFQCINLAGGMNAWADEIDPNIRKY